MRATRDAQQERTRLKTITSGLSQATVHQATLLQTASYFTYAVPGMNPESWTLFSRLCSGPQGMISVRLNVLGTAVPLIFINLLQTFL
jgi:hypothetical protein